MSCRNFPERELSQLAVRTERILAKDCELLQNAVSWDNSRSGNYRMMS